MYIYDTTKNVHYQFTYIVLLACILTGETVVASAVTHFTSLKTLTSVGLTLFCSYVFGHEGQTETAEWISHFTKRQKTLAISWNGWFHRLAVTYIPIRQSYNIYIYYRKSSNIKHHYRSMQNIFVWCTMYTGYRDLFSLQI